MYRYSHSGIRIKVGAKTVGLEGEGATGMFLLGKTKYVGRQSNLRLAFLLAVSEVVISKDGYHNAALVAKGDLERAALVVQLELIGPAHAGGLLGLGGLANVRQAEILLPEGAEMGCQDDAAGGSCPMFDVEGGIILGKMRIAGIAKDTLDEVNVGHASAGNEVAHLEALLVHDAGDLGLDKRADEEADHGLDGVFPGGGVGQDLEVGRGIEGSLEETAVGNERDGDLVRWDGQAPIGDVEYSLGGAPVIERVVQNAVAKTVGGDLFIVELVDVGVIGEAQLSGKAVAVDVESALTGGILMLGKTDALAGAS